MTPETMTMIIIGSIMSIIGMLVAVIGFFLVKTLNGFEKLFDKIESFIQDHEKRISKLEEKI